MNTRFWSILLLGAFSALLAGCGSAYSGATSKVHQLGAGEYMPAVDVPSKRRARYQQKDLPECRRIAANRQATASQEAQQTTTNVAVSGIGSGAVAGAAIGAVLDDDDRLSGAGKGALVGGLLGTAATVGSVGLNQQRVQQETKKVLLRCLAGRGYKVLEDI